MCAPGGAGVHGTVAGRKLTPHQHSPSGGLTPSRVPLSRFSTGSGEPSWNVALAWSWVVREGFLEEVDR